MRGERAGLLVQVAATIALCLGSGVLAAWVWQSRWTPVTGVALGHEFLLDGQGAPEAFSATGSYVGWALVFGALAGLLAGVVTRSHELVTVVVLLCSAGVAGWLMAVLGHAWGPPDPRPLAQQLEDFEPLVADLRVSGVAPYLAFPAGALLGLMTSYLVESSIHRVRRSDSTAPATLDGQERPGRAHIADRP